MSPRWLALLVVGAVGCDGCTSDDRPQTTFSEAPASPPDQWTLGAGRPDRIALPSVCRTPESPLVTVLDRPVRIASTPDVTAAIVREGSYDPVAGRAAWRPHAVGVLKMAHGPTSLELAIPVRPTAVASPSAIGWLAAVDHDGGSRLHSARDAWSIDPERPPADLSCKGDRCAVLTRDDAVLWQGRPGADGWTSTALGDQGLRILSLGDVVEVATADDLRVHVTRVDADGKDIVSSLSAPDGVHDVAPGPAALTRIADLDPRGCSPEAGGVQLLTPSRSYRLRSPLAPLRARLVPLGPATWLVVWMSPRRCGSRFLHQVYAAVVDGERGLLAPPMEVGRADDFAVASDGGEVGLWLTVEDGDHRATVTYAKARCDVVPRPEMR